MAALKINKGRCRSIRFDIIYIDINDVVERVVCSRSPWQLSTAGHGDDQTTHADGDALY